MCYANLGLTAVSDTAYSTSDDGDARASLDEEERRVCSARTLTVTLSTGKTEHIPVHDAQRRLEELTQRGTINEQAWVYLREN